MILECRAWSVKDKKMYYVEYGEGFFETNGSWWAVSKDEAERAGSFCNDILMQFTGLLDKNGTKIYEGDIVNVICRFDRANMVVCYENCQFVLRISEKIGYKHLVDMMNLEVIGNIYENPELLKEED